MLRKIVFILFCILLVNMAFAETEITVTEGDLVNLSVTASDPENDRLLVTFTEPVNNEGVWQTKFGDQGTYLINITATDGDLYDIQNIKLIVLEKKFA